VADKSDALQQQQLRLEAAQKLLSDLQQGSSQAPGERSLASEVGSKLRGLRFRSGSRPSSPPARPAAGGQPTGGGSSQQQLASEGEAWGPAEGPTGAPRWSSATREGRAGSETAEGGAKEEGAPNLVTRWVAAGARLYKKAVQEQ
jgi:hypothetical protein